MNKLLRKLLLYPEPNIPPEKAVEIAREMAKANGHPWKIPVITKETRKHWEIFTNASSRGGNVSVNVDKMSGIVVRYDFIEF